MTKMTSVLLLCLLPARCAFAQPSAAAPVKATLCEILGQPKQFNGKLVEFRAVVEPGLEDLPAGATDEHCSAGLKFFSPDDPHLAKLLKNGEFQKLVRLVKSKPVVEATITGRFQVSENSEYGLLLEAVAHVTAPRRK